MEARVGETSDVAAAFVMLYEQLRAVARARLAGVEGASLQATALVHEALLRLSGRAADSIADESHLLAAAAQAIRHTIVDYLRAKRAAKRNHGLTGPLSDSPEVEAMLGRCPAERADLAIDLDGALASLDGIDPSLRVIVELHVFGGLPFEEVAALTASSERTVRRRWKFAASLLRHKLDVWEE